MSFLLGFINFHVLRAVYAIFCGSRFMNFNYDEPGIPRTKYLCVGSDDWELFGGKIGGGRAPPSGSRTLAVLGL